jgi:NTP pyrophosphatase (non-canonical NTP hydrolase)
MNNLSFETLRGANVLRLPQFKNKHGQPAHTEPDGSDWSISEWIECVTGELGELANLHKKYRRGDVSKEELIFEGRKELADIQTYLDILAFQMNIDLGQATQDKFNEVSVRVGADVFIVNDKIEPVGPPYPHVFQPDEL